jgi:GTP-binding protein
MRQGNFIDRVEICCRSGKGGDGIVHFHREKYVPKGGPDGGNGGDGGNIIVKGDRQKWTLLHLRHQRHIFAENGEKGGSSNKDGAYGADKTIEVPLGTIIKDKESGQTDCEITQHQQEEILLKGGKGGKGNASFKSSTNQAPRKATLGEKGEEAWKVFELKILADVGLVGFPNAGKSTLLSVISAAKPKIAHYEFTTLQPNLGIVPYHEFKSFSVADIPGIIEGAHKGKGLGFQFLRHIERNAVLLFMVPVDSGDIKKEYETLIHELEQYSPDLLKKKRLLALSKSDLIDEELKNEIKELLPEIPHLFISSATKEGIDTLKDKLWQTLTKKQSSTHS